MLLLKRISTEEITRTLIIEILLTVILSLQSTTEEQLSVRLTRHDERKNKVNEGIRDESLVMYQNDHEEYDLTGTPINSDAQAAWPTTLVSDKSRVYKGGSWRDRAFWIVGSNRRFLDEDSIYFYYWI